MKKGFTLVELIGVIIVLGLIALIALPPILNAIREKESEISEASEEIIYNATSLYVSDNSNSFPKTNGNTFCVTLDTLTQGDYLPDVVYDAVSGDEVLLTNMVEVKYEQDRFSYNLNNECVEKIIKTDLIEILLEQYSPDNTTGLVQDETNSNIYYYKGTNEEVSNNYLWYGGHHWRVVEFDTDADTLTLITSQPITNISFSEDMWQIEEEYSDSYLNKWLYDVFYENLSSEVKSNIVEQTFNIGIYTNPSETQTIQKVGLLDVNQYERAGSTDSYLDIKDYFFFGNPYNYTSKLVSNCNQVGEVIGVGFFTSYGIRPVIKINDISVISGDGTLSNSYKTSYKSNGTADVQVGEYISVPTTGDECGSDKKCLFRVVKKEGNAVKVTLNGLLSELSIFGPDSKITKNHDIYKYIESFANSISDEYRSVELQKLYTGTVDITNCTNGEKYCGISYEDVQTSYLEASFGLSTYGEMFAANDIDLVDYNVFVNKNFLENPMDGYGYHSAGDPTSGLGIWYYLINDGENGSVKYINSNGYFSSHVPSTNDAVRPVIFLKNNLDFISGDGTVQNPYTLQ